MDLNFEVFNLCCHRGQESSYRVMSVVAVCVAGVHALPSRQTLQQCDGMDYCLQFTERNAAPERKLCTFSNAHV